MAAGKVGPDGEMFTLEANPEYAHTITRTASGLSENYALITVLCAAIAKERGVMDFEVSSNEHARSKLLASPDEEFPVAQVKQVLTVSGDELLGNCTPPDFVKIDVERAELLALEGSDYLLRRVRPILYIEISPKGQNAVSGLLKHHGTNFSILRGTDPKRPSTSARSTQ